MGGLIVLVLRKVNQNSNFIFVCINAILGDSFRYMEVQKSQGEHEFIQINGSEKHEFIQLNEAVLHIAGERKLECGMVLCQFSNKERRCNFCVLL